MDQYAPELAFHFGKDFSARLAELIWEGMPETSKAALCNHVALRFNTDYLGRLTEKAIQCLANKAIDSVVDSITEDTKVMTRVVDAAMEFVQEHANNRVPTGVGDRLISLAQQQHEPKAMRAIEAAIDEEEQKFLFDLRKAMEARAKTAIEKHTGTFDRRVKNKQGK
jgi:hypothetical protein